MSDGSQQLSPQHYASLRQQWSPQHFEVAGSQHSPSPSPAPPQQIRLPLSQHVSPQQVAVAVSQHVLPQPTWPEPQQVDAPGFGGQNWSSSQQATPQQCPAEESQQVSPQVSGLLQHVSPAHPLAGGSHWVLPHWLTVSAQTRLKQLPEQQSPSSAQPSPSSLAAQRSLPGQQTVPAGQEEPVQRH